MLRAEEDVSEETDHRAWDPILSRLAPHRILTSLWSMATTSESPSLSSQLYSKALRSA